MSNMTTDLTNEEHVKSLSEDLGIDHVELTAFIKQLIQKHNQPKGANETK